MEASFPPRPAMGQRVWSGGGYRDHGPMDGPKVDVPANMGGFVIAAVQPYFSMDFLLYSVRWDNGPFSKHYFKELTCIGRFADLVGFESAIVILGAKATVGPFGGFRGAEVRVRYDGVEQESRIYSDEQPLWLKLERMAAQLGIEIEVDKLPIKRSPKPSKPSPTAPASTPDSGPRTPATDRGSIPP